VNYDFIEVGTSNFNTLIQKCKPDAVGLSVEPLDFYLNDLPEKKNVQKINAALIPNDVFKRLEKPEIPIYYMPPEIIKRFKLPHHLQGCNSAGYPHNKTKKYSRFYETKIVPALSVNDFIEKFEIMTVHMLKMDTEGYDLMILRDFLASAVILEIIILEINSTNLLDKDTTKLLLKDATEQYTIRRWGYKNFKLTLKKEIYNF